MAVTGHEQTLPDAAIGSVDSGESRAVLENQLRACEQRLSRLPEIGAAESRAVTNLEMAEALLGLSRNDEAWATARAGLDGLIEAERWDEAVRACNVLYQADQPQSLAALGQGVWLAVTYPVDPELTVTLLHHIVDETPDDSDGAAVAAMTAHYIVGIRADGDQHDSLEFLTTQILASVAKRHKGMEDQQGLDIWIEMLELDDPEKFLPRLAIIVDALVGDDWWFDRDALRAKLPED